MWFLRVHGAAGLHSLDGEREGGILAVCPQCTWKEGEQKTRGSGSNFCTAAWVSQGSLSRERKRKKRQKNQKKPQKTQKPPPKPA